MFRKSFVIGLLIGFSVTAQNGFSSFSIKKDSLKNKNNLAEFIYVHLDEFAKNPSVQNLTIFESLDNSIWRNSKDEKEATALVYFYINYGFYLKEFGMFDKAILYYEKGFRIYQLNTLPKYDIIEYCLKPLANCYTRIGEIERAEDVLKVTIEKAQKQKNKDQIIATYINLSALLRTKGELKSAISYLQLGISLSEKPQDKTRLFSDLAINYGELGDVETSMKYLNLSNKLNILNNKGVRIRNAITLGFLYFKEGDWLLSEQSFSSALTEAKEFYKNNNREIAKIYVQLAEVNNQQREFKKAHFNFQNALKILLPNYTPTSIFINPDSTYFYPENTLKDIFDGRAHLFIVSNNLEEALRNFELSFKIEKELRSTYLTQNAKINQQQENRNRSEKCIELCYLLFKKTNNEIWIEKAFEFAERTKNSVVLEAKELLKRKSEIGKNQLFVDEDKLIFQRAQLNKEIAIEQLKAANANIVKLAVLTKERNSVSAQLQLIKTEIFEKFPQLSENVELNLLKQKIESKLLNDNNVFIEFFDGKSNLFKFSFSKNKPIIFERIEKDSVFENDLSSFLDYFADGRGSKIQNDIKGYKNLANKFYNLLFANLEAEAIILVPDGLLSFMPFDALLTKNTAITNFEKLPYLIIKHAISYAYSGSILLQENLKKQQKEQKIIGFFPVFEYNYRGLSELSYTLQEASSIKKQINGDYFLKGKATKKTFENLASNYDIIHLSTHATSGSFYEPAAIEFFDETLYLPEIYGYNLQTDLLVLSACETGIGTVRKGEGAMSLARAFSYAGVQNLIVSLWKVNDKATEILIAGFYAELKRSNNNSMALYLAKLNYLKNNDISSAKKSPYYWASFIYIGNSQAVTSTHNLWIVYFVGFFILLMAIIIIKKSSFNRK